MSRSQFKDPEMTEATQTISTDMPREETIVKLPLQISIARDVVNSTAAQEGDKERDVTDTSTIQDESNLEVDLEKNSQPISETITNASECTEFQQHKMVDDFQSINERMTKEERVTEHLHQASTTEGILDYSLEQGEEENVKDKPIDELKQEVVTGFERPETMPTVEKAVYGPSQDSTAEKIVNYSLREDVKATTVGNNRQPQIVPGIKVDETSETTKNERESRKDIVSCMPGEEGKTEWDVQDATIRDELKMEVHKRSQTTKSESETEISSYNLYQSEKPEMREATDSSTRELQFEGNVAEKPLQALTSEEAVNYSPDEEKKEERIVNYIPGDELKPEGHPGEMVEEIRDKVAERPLQVPTSEETIKYNQAEERKEENNVNDTTGDELRPEVHPGVKVDKISEITHNASRSTKLDETEMIDITQSFDRQTPREDKVDEEPNQVSSANQNINYNPIEKGKHEENTLISTKEGELKQEVKKDEIYETINSDCTEMKSEDKAIVIEEPQGPHQVSTSEETANYGIQEGEERNVGHKTALDELNQEVHPEVREEKISDMAYYASTKLEESETIDAAQNLEKQLQGEEKVVEGSPQVSNAEKNYDLAPEEKLERNINDPTPDELEVMVKETIKATDNLNEGTKFEEQQLIDVAQSLEKQMRDRIVEEPCEFPMSERAKNYSPEEEGKEGWIAKNPITEKSKQKDIGVYTDATTKTTIVASENTKLDETETTDQSFKEQTPRAEKVSEGPRQSPTGVEAVNHSPTEGEKGESNVKDKTMRSEQADEFPSTSIGTEVKTSNVKAESPKEELPKHEEFGDRGQQKEFINVTEVTEKECTEKLEELASEAEPVKPVHETIQDCPKREDVAKRQTYTTESEMDLLNKSESEVTTATGLLNLNRQEGCVDEDGNILLSGTSEDYENNKRENKEEHCLVTENESSTDTSSRVQESSFKDDKKDEKVEEQVKLSWRTSAIKIHEDEKEDKESHYQDKQYYSPIMEQDSAREFNGEPQLNKRPSEGVLPHAEGREAIDQFDDSNMQIAQKDELADLPNEDNKSGGPNMSSLEILAKDPETGADTKIAGRDKEMPVMQKGPTGETFQPEVEQLKPEDASKAVAETVREEYGEGEKPSRDFKEKDVPREKEYEDVPDQERNVNDSTTEIARNYGPMNVIRDDQEPKKSNDDKGTEKATEQFITEKTPMPSLANILEESRNENSKAAADFEIQSNQKIKKDGNKDGITGTLEGEEPNTDKDKDEEVDEHIQRKAESAYDTPVIVEPSRDADVKVAHKKSHNILSGVGSKVKHSIAKVKKAITGKHSHPKPSSPK